MPKNGTAEGIASYRGWMEARWREVIVVFMIHPDFHHLI